MKSVIVALLLVAAVQAITVTDMQLMVGMVYMLPVNNQITNQPIEAGSSVALKVFDENENLVHFFCFPPKSHFSIIASRYDANDEITEDEAIAVISLSEGSEAEAGLAQAQAAPQQGLGLFGRALQAAPAPSCVEASTPAVLSISTIYQARIQNKDFISHAPGSGPARLVGSLEGVNIDITLPPRGSVKAEVISRLKDTNVFWGYHAMDGPEGTNLTGSATDNPTLSYVPIKCNTANVLYTGTLTKWWVENGVVKSQNGIPGSSGCVLDTTLTPVPASTIVANTGSSCGSKIKVGETIYSCNGGYNMG